MHCGKDHHSHHAAGFIFLTLASVAMTLPFISYARDIANSIRMIAGRKTLNQERC